MDHCNLNPALPSWARAGHIRGTGYDDISASLGLRQRKSRKDVRKIVRIFRFDALLWSQVYNINMKMNPVFPVWGLHRSRSPFSGHDAPDNA